MSSASRKKALTILLTVLIVIALSSLAFIHITMKSLNLQKIDDYLYSADCGHISMEKADRLLSHVSVDSDVACSSIRKGSLHARNMDWYYSNEAEFVVRCGGHGEKYSSLSVISVSGIDDSTAGKGLYTPVYNVLQLYAVDGINEAGLVVNTNIVPESDVSGTTGTNDGGMRLCSMLIPRYLLDNAGSVDEARQ